MEMHNPPHPGEFIASVYMEPYGYSCRFVAAKLSVAHSTLNRIIKGDSAVSTDMALRLSRVLGGSPGSWLNMQIQYDLWQARQTVNHSDLEPFTFADEKKAPATA